MPAPGLVAAAVLAIVVALSVAPGFGTRSALSATAGEAVSVALVRDGSSTALSSGTALQDGDELRVATSGDAVVRIGGSYARMAGGSDLRIVSLDAGHVVLDQLRGRVYHRVSVASGDVYDIRTGQVTWEARGTAFDIDRETVSSRDRVAAMAVVDAVDISGPGLDARLPEGTETAIYLTSAGLADGPVAVAPIPADRLADAWLARNARLDAGLGLPLGWLEPLASASTSVPPTAATSSTPDVVSPAPSGSFELASSSPPAPSPTPQAVSTSAPSPPTSTPAPTPTAAPTIADLGTLAAADNLDLTVSFLWSPYTGAGLARYELVYELSSSGRTPAYIDGSPVWASPDAGVTSVAVAGIGPGNYQVRVEAICSNGTSTYVCARTSVIHIRLSAARSSPTPTATQ